MPDHDHSDESAFGLWEPVKYRFRYLPVHTAILHTGKVLAFGGSGNDPDNLASPAPAELWDPVSGAIKEIDQPLQGDIFCAGHTFLPDGKLLVAGGTHKYDGNLFGLPLPPFSGLEQSYLFDPAVEKWQRGPDMAEGRWYPTLLQLADGSVINVAGLTKGFPWVFLRSVELFSGNKWIRFHQADRWMPLYPRLHLLPDGDVFYSGSFNTHYTFPFTLKAFPTGRFDFAAGKWTSYGLPNTPQRQEGSSVLLPLLPPDYKAKVMLIGGGFTGAKDPTANAEIIDLSEKEPKWTNVHPMAHARYYCYSLILPDKKIFVMGGKKDETTHGPHADEHEPSGEEGPPQDPLAIREPELFDIETGTWCCLPHMSIDRLYHSGALLLPDGRVMTSGSNPERKQNELRIEIYQPSYLHRGHRPEITNSPLSARHGQLIEVESPEKDEVDGACLIRQSSTTHCLSTEQRYVGLRIDSRTSRGIKVQIPANPNVLPLGYYMLFILSKGVPSVAKFVRIVA